VNEFTRATTWLYATLTTPPISGAAGVFEHPAPEATASPWITFGQQAETDLAVIGERRVWADFLFLVRAISKGESSKALESIVDEIDSRLHRASGTTSDGRVVASVREEVFSFAEEDHGVIYKHLGGLYRLLVQPLSV
jgi:hypothetical protein